MALIILLALNFIKIWKSVASVEKKLFTFEIDALRTILGVHKLIKIRRSSQKTMMHERPSTASLSQTTKMNCACASQGPYSKNTIR